MKRGNCYVTCEALYHLLGGKHAGWVPMNMQHEGDSHWFLCHKPSGLVLDPTVSQFKETPNYQMARGRGFLTKRPSMKAVTMMRMMVWQQEIEQ